jgi:hypothetical protein
VGSEQQLRRSTKIGCARKSRIERPRPDDVRDR